MWDDFESGVRSVNGVRLAYRWSGAGPALLLLHGFPQTHLMWRRVAPALAQAFTVVCPDLRGYGASGCPPSSPDHSPYSKRTMAFDMVELMGQLGHTQFAVVGHDRGGRVAYRLALDHPGRVTHLAVLDIIPTLTAWQHADAAFAQSYWPWSLLSQPAPLPERLLEAAPAVIVDDALSNWGSAPTAFPTEVRGAYILPFRDPVHVHAICEEYRAAATLDCDHDAVDLERGNRISAPTLVLWSQDGPLDRWYADLGGPATLWQKWAVEVQGRALPGGHFFPETEPGATTTALRDFLTTRSTVRAI